MKILFYKLVAATLISIASSVAYAADTLTVDITKLSSQELALYQKLKTEQNNTFNVDTLSPERIDKYGQIGKAFGSAFKECWSTISTDAEKFSQSSAGKWAMFLVAWKIMGQDALGLVNNLIHYIVGIALFSIGIPFFIYIFNKNCIAHPELKSVTKVGWFTVKKEYGNMIDPIHTGDVVLVYFLAFAILIGLISIILFT